MKKIVFLNFLLLLSASIANASISSLEQLPQGNCIFRFKKSVFPNKYYLIILNGTKDRTIVFYGEEANYYIIGKDGQKTSITDMRAFQGIGTKGRIWVGPGFHTVIPFRINKNLVKNSKEIIFKGTSSIQKLEGHFINEYDKRELIVTYNNDTGEITAEVSDKLINVSDPLFEFNFGQKPTDNDAKKYLEKEVDYRQIRLLNDADHK